MEEQIPSKKCTKCGVVKPLTEFYQDRRVKKDGRAAQCKTCSEKEKRAYRATHKTQRSEYERNKRLHDAHFRELAAERNKKYLEKLKAEGGERLEKQKQRKKEYQKTVRRNNPAYYLWKSACSRARKAGIPCNIDLEDIIIPERCPILDIPLYLHEGKPQYDSCSLDRINPKLGYVKGNIAVISRMANTMKQDASRDELETFCKNILNYLDRKDIVRTTENSESVELEDKEPLG